MSKQTQPLYQRGRYKLVEDRRRDGSLRTPFYQIVWYDGQAGRNRSRSTRTASRDEAEIKLDALYESEERGRAICHACGQPITNGPPYLLTDAIAAYIDKRQNRVSISAIRPRLGHVLFYLEAQDALTTTCDEIDDDWIEEFRDWNAEVPIELPKGDCRRRAPGTIEASVRQLAAVINYAARKKHVLRGAQFSPKKPTDVSHTPTYRASIETLAAMFRYCTEPERMAQEGDKSYAKRIADRRNLLRFLQISVATWARPDAAHDVSTDAERGQWDSEARKLNLNPKGRIQTRKYRPTVPIARQVAPLLDDTKGFFVTVASVRKAFEAMQDALGLPGDREAGMKLIRRSMAQLGRDRLGRTAWIEGKYMLGHHRPDPSDLYGIDTPGEFPLVLKVNEQIIDEIIQLAPKAFRA